MNGGSGMNDHTDADILSSARSSEVNQSTSETIRQANPMKETLLQIYQALCEKGYDPARQIAGYILSEDPVYITDWKNARGMIGHVNRDDLLIELIRNYLET